MVVSQTASFYTVCVFSDVQWLLLLLLLIVSVGIGVRSNTLQADDG